MKDIIQIRGTYKNIYNNHNGYFNNSTYTTNNVNNSHEGLNLFKLIDYKVYQRYYTIDDLEVNFKIFIQYGDDEIKEIKIYL